MDSIQECKYYSNNIILKAEIKIVFTVLQMSIALTTMLLQVNLHEIITVL